MSAAKPFSESCQRNREPILQVLRQHLAHTRRVLEIGSGTGQHAAYFAQHLPHLQWQPSDQPEYLAGIKAWRDDARLSNLQAPQPLWADADQQALAGAIDAVRDGGDAVISGVDAVFSANTLHIMSWASVQALFAGLPVVLADNAQTHLLIYGPFNREGAFTSDSNRVFDGWLKQRDRNSGIRDFEAVHALAKTIGFNLIDDVAMPANNSLLVWRKDP